jgi:lipoprotein-releasing system permease protein
LATKVSFLIAKRYLFSWKKRNAINLITIISIIGIAVTTAALVILISAFNGIEQMIDRMYSEFDTDLTIISKNSKTFHSSQIDFSKIKKMEEIQSISRSIEELVILKNGDKWVNAKLIGVDKSFLGIANMNNHLLHNKKINDCSNFILPGAELLEKLQLGIDHENNYDPIVLYAPKRKIAIKPGQNPFYLEKADVTAIMNYNRDVNSEIVLTDFEFASELLQYENECSAIWIDLKENANEHYVKEKLQEKLGSGFEIKTRFEKNELIFKTSQSEKIIVICILIFVFVLAAFNLIASLTMLFVEKKKNFTTFLSFGLSKRNIFAIFVYEGILISGTGLILGLCLGYLVCFMQMWKSLIVLPGTTEAFPIDLTFRDGLFIIMLVTGLSLAFSYFTVHFLIRNNFSKEFLIRKVDY